jgi:hypothetical protein
LSPLRVATSIGEWGRGMISCYNVLQLMDTGQKHAPNTFQGGVSEGRGGLFLFPMASYRGVIIHIRSAYHLSK